jgi:hypothetical protein
MAYLNRLSALQLIISKSAMLTEETHNNDLLVEWNARAHQFCNALNNE